jgi:hypothetical protein
MANVKNLVMKSSVIGLGLLVRAPLVRIEVTLGADGACVKMLVDESYTQPRAVSSDLRGLAPSSSKSYGIVHLIYKGRLTNQGNLELE